MKETLQQQVTAAVRELCDSAQLRPGQILVVGCSTSEVRGQQIGTDSTPDTAAMIVSAIEQELRTRGVYLAAQCCEHLNRCIIVERAAVPMLDPVNVVPQPKAGGSFATAVYGTLSDPVAVEQIRGDAGLDIGGTLIGMHLKQVAVPVRLATRQIGEALVLAARTRPKFIGGTRAQYDAALL